MKFSKNIEQKEIVHLFEACKEEVALDVLY